MADIPLLQNYKVVLPKGQFNGLCVHCTTFAWTRTLVWSGPRCVRLPVAVGCARRVPWVLPVEVTTQSRHRQNKKFVLWPSYYSANNWKCCTLIPKTEEDKKEAQESISCVLNAFKARMEEEEEEEEE